MAAEQLRSGVEMAAEEGLLVNTEFAPEVDYDGGCPGLSASDQDFAASRPPRRLTRGFAHAVGGGAVGLLLAAAAICSFHRIHGTSGGAVEDSVGFSFFGSMTEVLGSLRDGVKALDTVISTSNESFQNFTEMVHNMKGTAENLADTSNSLYASMNKPNKWRIGIRKKIQGMNATQKAAFKKKLMKKLNITSLKQLRPVANLSDGNPCADNEEDHAGLCYSRCSDLSAGKFPHRTSAWSCCSHEPPCGYSPGEQHTVFNVCGGYGTSPAADGCPHARGSCLVNEEMYNGYCYKKCAFITFGVLPHRSGAASCCHTDKKKSRFRFLDLDGCDTDAGTYAVGGGRGYDPLEPVEVHQPIVALVEGTA
uniref:Uncharacterized protein n=1 Tax=Alexandrium catenella TaxID=2925 RepID=A0A7S1LT52_ALECA